MIPTKIAKAYWTEHRFRGKGLFDEVVGKDLSSILSLVVGKGFLSEEDEELVAKYCALLLVADPHIWPVKSARIGATYGSTFVGAAIGATFLESRMAGPLTLEPAARLLVQLVGENIEPRRWVQDAVSSGRQIPGFGVAMRKQDERAECLKGLVPVEKKGRYWRMFEALAEELFEQRKIEPNVAIVGAALLLDLGFEPVQVRDLSFIALLLALYANAIESAEQKSPILQKLPADCVHYTGPAPRKSPRREAAEK